MSPSTVYRYMKLLEENNNISIKVNSKFSLVSIVNWELYQTDTEKVNNKWTTNEQQMNIKWTQTRKIKKDNKVKNIIDRNYDENFLNGIYANGG